MIAAIGSAQNGDHDLQAGATVFDADPLDASNVRVAAFYLAIGDGAKDLDGTGGDLEISILIDSVPFDGAAQVKTIAASTTQLILQTEPIIVPANSQVEIVITSPNVADDDVDVTVQAYDVDSPAAAPTVEEIRSEIDSNSTALGTIATGIAANLTAIGNLNDLDSTAVQTACAAALTAYDPPTNAEMEARTLVAANYATASALTTVDTVVDGIKAVTDELTISDGVVSASLATTYVPYLVPNFTSTAGTTLAVQIALSNQWGQTVDPEAVGSAISGTLKIREFGAAEEVLHVDATFDDDDLVNEVFELSLADPSLAADKLYEYEVVVTIDAVSYMFKDFLPTIGSAS